MHNICGSKPQIPEGMLNPSVPLTAEFFANPRCPPSALVAASTLDPVAVSGEDRSENSPSTAGGEAVLPTDQEEAVLSMGQEEAVLPLDLLTEYNLSFVFVEARLFLFAASNNLLPVLALVILNVLVLGYPDLYSFFV